MMKKLPTTVKKKFPMMKKFPTTVKKSCCRNPMNLEHTGYLPEPIAGCRD